MNTTMSREAVGELVNETAACVRRVVAVHPMYQYNSGDEIADRAVDFVSNVPWSGKPDYERTLGDLVQECAVDPERSTAPARLAEAVTAGHLGDGMAWHALSLAAGGFCPDLVIAYLGGPKAASLTGRKAVDAGVISDDKSSVTVAHAYLPAAETDPDNPVQRVAMTLCLEDESDWTACRAEVSRIIDRGNSVSEWEVDLAIRLAAAMEDFERRDTRTAGGQTAKPIPGPRPDADRELLERAIELAPLVTEAQKRRLRLLADGIDPDLGVTE